MLSISNRRCNVLKTSASRSMTIYLQLLVIVVLASTVAGTIPLPVLPPGKRPNFIVIVTDDQGWDDIGLNNPKYVNTPNLDKFIKGGTLFDNFYTAPQCAQTRAQLLTGRAFPRTGTMLTHGCYDFIHSNESTMGAVLQQGGYYTAQYGKWHNLDVLGYEPWHVGFQESAIPKNTGPSSLMVVNGVYAPNTKRYIEQALSDRVLHFAAKQLRKLKNPDAPPFLLYYSAHAIHVSYTKYSNGTLGSKSRFFPPEYKDKYHYNPYYQGVPVSTLDAWAMLDYLDSLLGLLWDLVAANPLLRDNTYVMVMSDNGSSLMDDEQKQRDKYRMPSKMRGNKSTLNEGGIRGWLAVQGPGIPAGVIDSTLLEVADILPTIVDLAGIDPSSVQHLRWDGMSFKNLLLAPDPAAAAAPGQTLPAAVDGTVAIKRVVGVEGTVVGVPYEGAVRRGTVLSTPEQWERYVVMLGPQCWDGDLVLELNKDREVLRPQPLLHWKDGGMANSVSGNKGAYTQEASDPGLKMCVIVRHKRYKWFGLDNKVYRLDSRHLEDDSALVTGELGKKLAKVFADVAKSWWDQMIVEPHSFEKPVFYLGLGNWTVTNMVGCGAYQRTRKAVTLRPIGASGFVNPGDQMCFNLKVLTNGTYDVTIFYVSAQWATFKLCIGTHASILAGTAPSVIGQLPPSKTLAGRQMGSLAIPAFLGRKIEACLVLVTNEAPGIPVMKNLANIRLTRMVQDIGASLQPGDNSSTGSNTTAQLNQTDSGLSNINGSAGNDSSDTLPAYAVPGDIPTSDIPGSHVHSSGTPAGDASTGVTSPGDTQAGDVLTAGNPITDTPATAGGSTGSSSNGTGSTVAPVAAAAAGIDVLGRYSWLLPASAASSSGASSSSSSSSSSATRMQDAWEEIRWQHGWPDGQYVMESMLAPYEWEDTESCQACQITL